MYPPSVELTRGCCRQFKKGYCRSSSPRYYISHVNRDSEEDEVLTDGEEARLVVQMDTESSIIDEKTCLDFYFDKPVRVSSQRKTKSSTQSMIKMFLIKKHMYMIIGTGEWRHTHHILPENDWKPSLLYLLQHSFHNQWLASGKDSLDPSSRCCYSP